jgi:type IV pilus assembly protein PilO
MDLGLNKLSWYVQILLFVVLGAVGIYMFQYFYADTKEQELAAKQTELEQVRARVTKGNLIAQQLPMFQAEVIKLEQRLAGLKQVLPEQRDVGDMLRRIQTLAAQSSLNVRTYRPQAVTNKELHAEWPMMIEFDGTYHDLGLFFDRVSKVPRIINISGIAIKGKSPADIAATNTTVSAQCLATTFVLLDKPVGKPGADGKLQAANTAAAPR